MQTFFYAVLHFMTDGLCAFAMYSRFRPDAQWMLFILIYDFCAFVLQLPFGALMDRLKERLPGKEERLPFACAMCGALLTVAGMFTHPAVLGLGNALFHVGGGVGTIAEDRKKDLRGAALGIFVAPGAMGLFLGTFFGNGVQKMPVTLIMLIMTAVYLSLFLFFGTLLKKREGRIDGECADDLTAEEEGKAFTELPASDAGITGKKLVSAIIAAAFCFIVVMLRSYAGIAIGFSWRSGFWDGFICTLAIVLGKMAGGFLTARFGISKVMTATLIPAALCYFFSFEPAAGVAALFLFNMTMPVTLYMIADRFRGLEGFSFGLLTAALFLGIVPGFAGMQPILPGQLLGPAICLVSLALLLAAVLLFRRGKR
ncbi:MAG: hypothetical protein IJM50_02465 [Lachnospiraceae bacterium]|nr:hypothetical protein [Lachnospiraceae bacterium]